MYGYDYLVWKEARDAAAAIQRALDALEPDVAREVRSMLELRQASLQSAFNAIDAQRLMPSQASALNAARQAQYQGGSLASLFGRSWP